VADLDDFFAHRNSRRVHNLLVLIDRDPPPTMQELIKTLTAEDEPTEDNTQN
jgi:hypothetical protein